MNTRSMPIVARTAVALVVDDDPVMRILIRKALETDGFSVHEAENGHHAVGTFSHLQPDIVLMDVMMPELDGFGACRGIRELPQGTRTPILMLTGLDDVDSINQAFDAGATDFIAKPINWGILGYRVRYLLRSANVLEQFVRNQESLAEARRIAHLGNWEWDIEKDRVYWSAGTYRVLGLESGATTANISTFMERVHPEERLQVQEALKEFVK